MRTKARVWAIVEVAKPGDKASRFFDITILLLIFLNVLATIIGTVPAIEERDGRILFWFEAVSVAVFTGEYVARLWSCTADSRYSHPLWGRLRLATTGMLVIDLAAILPFFLPVLGIDLRTLRVLRLLRIVRIAKVGRYYSALTIMRNVFRSKREELVLTMAMMMFLLIISASILYYCENPHQPEAFSSIPAAMWWSIATLTTVGYGDVYPITTLGKLFASVIAILGIGMFALPTGILGAGFVEEIQRSKVDEVRCPHCQRPIR